MSESWYCTARQAACTLTEHRIDMVSISNRCKFDPLYYQVKRAEEINIGDPGSISNRCQSYWDPKYYHTYSSSPSMQSIYSITLGVILAKHSVALATARRYFSEWVCQNAEHLFSVAVVTICFHTGNNTTIPQVEYYMHDMVSSVGKKYAGRNPNFCSHPENANK